MNNTFLIILIIALTSCSNRTSNDLENMGLYGNIKSIHEEQRDNNNKLLMTKVTYFTNSGMVKSIEYYYPQNQVTNKSLNHYNFKNQLTRQDIIMNDNLMISQKYLRINFNKDSILAYSSNGDIINTAVLVYNNNKQVVESNLYDLQKKLIYSETIKYNKDNQLTETRIKSLDPSSNGDVYTYSYDSKGRMQTFTMYNLINNFESNEIYAYETDDVNNWIKKQTTSSKGELISTVTREIEYK
jgi:hypothetical protein